jgi:hypothetical protein
VSAWGTNTYGQLDVPPELAGVIAVSAGNYFNLVLREDGTVSAWGDPAGCVSNRPPDLTNIVAVAAGEYTSMALRSDGTVATWGKDYAGSVPNGLRSVIGIAGGYTHCLALVGDGRPVVTVQPFRRKVAGSSQSKLSVMAAGASPLSYQWQLNGVDIPGATGRSLPLAQVTAAGTYSVTVSNALGTTSSTASIVTPGLRFDTFSGATGPGEDGFHLRLLGLSGRGYAVIYASTNLAAWQPIFTNLPVVGALDYADGTATNQVRRFYRAVEADFTLGALRLQVPLLQGPPQDTVGLRINGLSGFGPAIVSCSTNLLTGIWQPIATNPPAIGSWDLAVPLGSLPSPLFFRVLEQR